MAGRGLRENSYSLKWVCQSLSQNVVPQFYPILPLGAYIIAVWFIGGGGNGTDAEDCGSSSWY